MGGQPEQLPWCPQTCLHHRLLGKQQGEGEGRSGLSEVGPSKGDDSFCKGVRPQASCIWMAAVAE